MADDSPGKVQALRAIFSEKNKPLMGMLPPSGKISTRPWSTQVTSSRDTPALKEKKFNELKFGNKVLPTPEKNSTLSIEPQNEMNGFNENTNKTIPRPVVGPKPPYLVHQQRSVSSFPMKSESVNGLLVQNGDNMRHITVSDGQSSKAKAFGETIASFMFTNNKENEKNLSGPNSVQIAPPPIPKPRTSQIQNSVQNHVEIMNLCNVQSSGVLIKNDSDNRFYNINTDNYICKTSSCRVRRKVMPSQEKLGIAPLKPIKPSQMKLPDPYSSSSSSSTSSSSYSSSVSSSRLPPQVPPPMLTQKPVPQRPSYPCPPRPHTPPPLPPILAPVIKPTRISLREELEELYEDTIQGEKHRPVSLIPEYTEEEEQAEELYHDSVQEVEDSSKFLNSLAFLKNKKPPPPVPSEYLQPNIHGSIEELYQDADELETEEFYEVMPCDEIPEDSGSPLYSNNKKEIEKLKKEEEKRIRKEQKEKEKKEKEIEKLKKKFGLTGGEIPIDDGLVKCDSRGGKGDLPVKKGETVLILRMEGNPSGRWLVKNEKGKIGYVELTNIEVDPLSVKSVMSIRRFSVISDGEELYCEAKSEEEGIYEVTF